MTRVISAIVLGGIVLAVLLFAPPVFSLILIAGIVLAALKELSVMLSEAGAGFSYPWAVLGAGCLLAGVSLGYDLGLAAGAVAAVLVMSLPPVFRGVFQGASHQIAGGLFSVIVVGWTLAHAMLYFRLPHGRIALLFPLAIVWVTDTSAFYVGSAFGRRKLAPRISPNKTVEGFIAGLLSSCAVALAFRYLSPLAWSLPFLLVSGVILSAVGQLGDLVESAIKRDAGVKDSGALIPGHGGVLDRIDSVVFTLPVFYYLVRWVL
ncbi:MAG: phosphatidate cytidylyltransferase [bacterium]|nr:MAG: phosphatidate cytidylyltransferase [bacterium]